MADNIALLDGTGTLIAADQVDGVHVLRIKPQMGEPGEARDVSGTSPLPVADRSPALSVHRTIGLGVTPEMAKDSGGKVFGWHLSNGGTNAAYVKLYDAAEAPSVGSAAPLLTLLVPASGVVSSRQPNGIPFEEGIYLAATTGAGDTDTGAPAALTVIVNLFYR